MDKSSVRQVRRWRFQFSLRILIGAVLVIAVIWLVTYKVGGAALAEQYAEEYRNAPPLSMPRWPPPYNPSQVNDYFRVIVTGETLKVEKTQLHEPPLMFKGRAYAAAPCVLIWTWEGLAPDQQQECDIYLWFFGWKVALRRHEPPHLRTIYMVT